MSEQTEQAPDEDRGSGGLQRTTPRIDAVCRCRCAAPITWDEVYGWVHSAGPGDRCRTPQPAATTP